MGINVLKSNGAAADAYASLIVASDPAEYWFQVDVLVPAATFTAIASRQFTGDIFEINGGAECVFLTGHELGCGGAHPFSFGNRNLWPCDSPCATTAFPVGVWTTVKINSRFDAGTGDYWVDWYLDGAPIGSWINLADAADLLVGQRFANHFLGEIVYIDNVRLGTTNGGVEIFCDDFESGDLSAWTSVTGDVSVVADPLGTGGPTGPCVSPGFQLAASPAAVTVIQGSSINSAVSSVLVSPPNDLATLSVSGAPAGMTVTFATNPIIEGGGASVVTITADPALTPGSYPFTINGVDPDGRTSTCRITVTVREFIAVPGGGFSVRERVPFN